MSRLRRDRREIIVRNMQEAEQIAAYCNEYLIEHKDLCDCRTLHSRPTRFDERDLSLVICYCTSAEWKRIEEYYGLARSSKYQRTRKRCFKLEYQIKGT